MKVLTKKTDYAIRALLALAAGKDSYVSAKTISAEQDIPYQFLRGLLQEMIGMELIISKEGVQGGFKLHKDADKIQVKHLIEGFQGKVQVSECMFRKQLCKNRATCVLRHEIMRIEQVVSNEFEKITIGTLFRNLQMVNGLHQASESARLTESLQH
ncbi:MAG: Rrf2 family transcriptional regulator [Chlorobiaceae bacterium]|nr:Rrf2 family transcriptional regulator [Chlorobiaceae bacterium]